MNRVGFALFQKHRLVHHGLQYLHQRSKATPERNAAIRFLVDLLDEYKPDILLLPKSGSEAWRRSVEVESILSLIEARASATSISVHCFTDGEVKVAFRDTEGVPAKNKTVINRVLVERYPRLKIDLPPARRIWDSEPYYTPLFNAAALHGAWEDRIARAADS